MNYYGFKVSPIGESRAEQCRISLFPSFFFFFFFFFFFVRSNASGQLNYDFATEEREKKSGIKATWKGLERKNEATICNIL